LFYFQYGNLKWQNGSISTEEAVLGDDTCQLSFQPSALPIKPQKSKKRTETKGLYLFCGYQLLMVISQFFSWKDRRVKGVGMIARKFEFNCSLKN